MKKLLWVVISLYTASWIVPSKDALATSTDFSERFSFRVFLDEKEIGYHRFDIQRNKKSERVSIDANFDIKFLFVNVYSYEHIAEEVWNDQCLERLESETKESGEEFFVSTNASNNGLQVETKDGLTVVDGCVRSFAYWDINRLDVRWLLNSQTGKYVPTKLESKGSAELQFEGTKYTAQLYVLHAEDAEIELYYDEDGRWMALKTQVKGGRTLAYHQADMPSLGS